MTDLEKAVAKALKYGLLFEQIAQDGEWFYTDRAELVVTGDENDLQLEYCDFDTDLVTKYEVEVTVRLKKI
jgi:hypothetical protein